MVDVALVVENLPEGEPHIVSRCCPLHFNQLAEPFVERVREQFGKRIDRRVVASLLAEPLGVPLHQGRFAPLRDYRTFLGGSGIFCRFIRLDRDRLHFWLC
ncbi:hypothetical protein AB0L88_24585 [Saccharopolyspora shandongensis]|uniref:hypothetical protein n=1 Tax=Saccharopolyspora shandongensis TaxID=418495 RepID=UPI00341983C5